MTNRFQHKSLNNPSLRRGQVITTFGPGALVNFESGSFIGMGIDSWPQRIQQNVIYEDRLQKKLNVQYFRQPPSVEDYRIGLPYRRFPRWLFCPKCRVLQTYQKWDANDIRKFAPLRCPNCKIGLVPMSFLVICIKGHIDDFPWIYWAHKAQQPCRNEATLKYTTSLSGAGLGSTKIECTHCNSSRSMEGAFSKDAFDFKCGGSEPWSRGGGSSGCTERLVTVQRGASNVYFPQLVTSITIPPYTDTLWEKIRQSGAWQRWLVIIDPEGLSPENPDNPILKTKLITRISVEISEKEEEIRRCLTMIEARDGELIKQSEEDFRRDEYKAFHGEYDRLANNKRDFEVVPGRDGFDYSSFNIQDIFLVKALREVRALVGFTRLKPYERDQQLLDTEEEDSERAEPVSLSDHAHGTATWKAAVEVRGEGIFITFDEAKLGEWERRPAVVERLKVTNRFYESSCKRRKIVFKPIGAKFLLLHTFSHLLIRQLSFESGYSGASLRERIYCDTGSGLNRMQGILIYTAAGDADGTLGGLVRQAKKDRFPAVLETTFENAMWCANDPLCIESGGQGFESLNMAACYACSLLPETSCEEFNRFLDRALVVGVSDNPSVGFFSDLKQLYA